MNKFLCLILLLCFLFVFSSCSDYVDVEVMSSYPQSSEQESSSVIISSEESSLSTNTSEDVQSIDNTSKTEISADFESLPKVIESEKYGDLLLRIPSGKKVTALGDLSDAKYSDAVTRLETILKGYSREISLVAYSLDNTKAISFNAEAEIFPACTVKAAYSLYNCLEMDKGNGSLETIMKYEKKHYEPGTGDMQYKPVGTEFDMKTIIHKSMSISDNVGYMMQVDYFGRDPYNQWISDIGCPSLQIKPTVWALRAKADEHAVLWREIYRYLISGADHSEFLYSTCTGTADNFASKALSNVSYSHKQGFNRDTKWNSMSDAGIVWKDGNPYVIVILTNSEGITSSAQKVMNEAIKIIHNEMF